MKIINVRTTYRRTNISTLEALSFRDVKATLKELKASEAISECVVIQTCHRVEFYVVPRGQSGEAATSTIAAVMREWRERAAAVPTETFCSAVEVEQDGAAVRHLLRLTAGLESLVVGESQILGQVREAYNLARESGCVGPVLADVFQKALRTGAEVRSRTGISKGAVSLGSVAVNLIERVLGSLNYKKVAIIGAGMAGTLVAKALRKRKIRGMQVFVVNRTYEKGLRLAEMLRGRAVRYDRINEILEEADAAIVASSAPHPVITLASLKETAARRSKPLVIMDLSQPRNVEEEVAKLPNVHLQNIDGLREIAESSLKARLGRVGRAEEIIEARVGELEAKLRQRAAEPLIDAIYSRAETLRAREFKKALKLMGELDREKASVIEELTRVIVERTLNEPAKNLRRAAENGDLSLLEAARRLFSVEKA